MLGDRRTTADQHWDSVHSESQHSRGGGLSGVVYSVSLGYNSGGVSVAFFSILVRPWDSLMIAIDRAIPIIGDPGRFSANDRLKSRCATLFVLLSDFLTLIAERFIRDNIYNH